MDQLLNWHRLFLEHLPAWQWPSLELELISVEEIEPECVSRD